MVLYFIGLGLGDAKDITVKGLEIVKKCSRVYLEHYTSILTCGQEELEKFYGRSVILADRDMVEQVCTLSSGNHIKLNHFLNRRVRKRSLPAPKTKMSRF